MANRQAIGGRPRGVWPPPLKSSTLRRIHKALAQATLALAECTATLEEIHARTHALPPLAFGDVLPAKLPAGRLSAGMGTEQYQASARSPRNDFSLFLRRLGM